MRFESINRRWRGLLLGGAVIVIASLALSCGGETVAEEGHDHTESQASVWTCSMHPQVRSDGPGDCPLCGMDLIPVEEEAPAEEVSGRSLTVSEPGRKLMEIETSPVMRMAVAADIALVGKVTYDEGRVSRISAWVPGRIEKLHVDYVGYEVRAGVPMVDLYGPELVAAQEELINSYNAYREAQASGDEGLVESTGDVVQAVHERLRLWGLSEAQIAEIETWGTAEPRLSISAPISGTVVEKSVTEGAYVTTGQMLFTIADLSVVWIELSAYESDLALLAPGQPVQFTVEAVPGREFTGVLSFVEPIVDPVTRTVAVRVEVGNEERLLMPGMFVRADVKADARGHGGRAPLVIPATAPLLTGKRAVVYVELKDADAPTFEGREVTLGPRAGDFYIVVEGLAEGERVVTEGAFKLDSALQIRAKPSMMSPDAGEGRGSQPQDGGAGHHH
ncbi:MAG: efflux RND transporter periplasmic adaptor subunit [Candidatus Eisenbacteria bacterium]|nr:efflux RND transporter periplasmic adaptor subunit [Candidatus Eisenbacteria bacterium]